MVPASLKAAAAPYVIGLGLLAMTGGGWFLWHKGSVHGQAEGKKAVAEQVEKQYHDELVAIKAERELALKINTELLAKLARLPTSTKVKEAVSANPSACPVAPAVTRSLRDQAASANAARSTH